MDFSLFDFWSHCLISWCRLSWNASCVSWWIILLECMRRYIPLCLYSLMCNYSNFFGAATCHISSRPILNKSVWRVTVGRCSKSICWPVYVCMAYGLFFYNIIEISFFSLVKKKDAANPTVKKIFKNKNDPFTLPPRLYHYR